MNKGIAGSQTPMPKKQKRQKKKLIKRVKRTEKILHMFEGKDFTVSAGGKGIASLLIESENISLHF